MSKKIEVPKGFFKQFKSQDEFHSFFSNLFKQGVEEMLQAELDTHLGYEKHSTEGYNTGNSRNGSFKKKVVSDKVGEVVLNIPRDRNATFQPQVIPKGKSMTESIEDAIIGMYGRGMTTSDITEQVVQIYGTSISETTVSNITNRILTLVEEWQNRPLEPVYLCVWMDGIFLKVRQDGMVKNMCIYLVIGLRNDGLKEVLGMWLAPTESASFWLSVLSDLKNRGVQDILIACTDNLNGFTSAIQSSFPNTITQLCVIHQIRTAAKFVARKDSRLFHIDMKAFYAAPNINAANTAFQTFKQTWNHKYAYAIKSWEDNWANLVPYFDFPPEIRKIMYTTNTIENLNRGIRKYTKAKSLFVNENAAKKAVFLAISNIEKKWYKPIPNFGLIINQFLIIFEHRCRL